MTIDRAITESILNTIRTTQKAIILYGPRQAGKTTLVKHIIKKSSLQTLMINADQQKYTDVLSSRDLDLMKGLIGNFQMLVIDEAQRIPDIGINLKILIDGMPNLRVIATGSSSFDLANKIREPLTGRTITYTLYPLAVSELLPLYTPFELSQQLQTMLIFGTYPEIYTTTATATKRLFLEELVTSYLYKDMLDLASIKHPKKIRDLLKLLAFQIGSEVSLRELSGTLGLSHEAVERYIDLLEKSFVIFRLSGFSRNLRKEVTKMDKIYFYDTGVRNIVIDNVNPLASRNDAGQLWENFCIAQRRCRLSYSRILASSYFWRVRTGAELDYVEDRGGIIYGYECKWSTKKNSRIPKSWQSTYPHAQYESINPTNYFSFLAPSHYEAI